MAIWPSMSMTPGQAASVRAQTARPARRVIAGTQSSSRPAWPSSRWVIGEPARSCFPSLRMRVRHPAGWQGRNPSVASTPSFEMAKRPQRREYAVLRGGKAAFSDASTSSCGMARPQSQRCEYVILRDGRPQRRVYAVHRGGKAAHHRCEYVVHADGKAASSPLRVRRSRGWPGRTGDALGRPL